MADDARRRLAWTAGRADERRELLQRPRGAPGRLHARARASRSARRSASLPAVLRGSAGRTRPRLRDRRRRGLRAAVGAWSETLGRAAAGEADLLHVHHLTPANEAAIRCFPSLPILGQLHGTELAFLRTVEAGPPAGWRYAARWAERMRGWAQQCELVLVPPGAEAEAALLLGLERGRLRSLPGGVDPARFTRRPLAHADRFAFWRRWLVDEPRGWDM
ncbi:MAG: glycosyltransferase, partial [Actinobacteria bacterium]|nr:glycosyltransferase [Actinomycetota bacterium]